MIKTKKIFFIICFILAVMICIIIIFKNVTKNNKIGNNINSQEIVDNILNLNSYTAKVFVQVNSNKNHNKYILHQEYNTINGYIQEVLEPENIAGVKIIVKDNKLSIQNTQLSLNSIFENYKELENNSLDLNNFIKQYKDNSSSYYEEKNEEIVMKTISKNNNNYQKYQILYINKEKKNPTKLIIQDNNQNTTINIEYNEIELK